MADNPRWTEPLQMAADDLSLAASAAARKYDLSLNDVMIAMVMAAAKFSPTQTKTKSPDTAE